MSANPGSDSDFPVTRVDNVVANFSLGIGFSQQHMAEMVGFFACADYKRNKFEAVRITSGSDDTKLAAQVYRTGNVLIHAKSTGDAYEGACQISRVLRSRGHRTTLTRFRVSNVVLSAKLPFNLDLDLLNFAHRKYVQYFRRDRFAGLCYKLDSRHGPRYSVSFTVFPNGKILIRTNNNDADHIRHIWSCFMPHLRGVKIEPSEE